MTTGAAIERDFLHRAMDARAENLAQGRLVHNPSPDCDSLLEHLQALAKHVGDDPAARGHLAAALRIIVTLVESNRREGEHERQIAGKADQLVTDLRRAQHRPQPAQLWNTKTVEKALRDPLANLCNPAIKGKPRKRALAALHAVFDQAPTQLVLSLRVGHNLGVAKRTLLYELHAEYVAAQTGAAA